MRIPYAAYLSALSTFGFDVHFLVTGIRSADALDPDSQELLYLYSTAPLAIKAAALAALTAGNSASNSITVSGKGNRIAGRDFNENKK